MPKWLEIWDTKEEECLLNKKVMKITYMPFIGQTNGRQKHMKIAVLH